MKRVLALVCVLGLLMVLVSACATTQEIEKLQAQTNEALAKAQSAVEQANSAAKAAEDSAMRAEKAADRAEAMADKCEQSFMKGMKK